MLNGKLPSHCCNDWGLGGEHDHIALECNDSSRSLCYSVGMLVGDGIGSLRYSKPLMHLVTSTDRYDSLTSSLTN